MIYEPGESVSNEIKITDAKTVSIAGNIHRAILSQGHNRISISSDELGINTQVEYQDGFKANAESNGVIVGNGEVSLNGKNRVSIDAKSTQLDHKSFADSFVIRGGAINEDSCDGCTRHWDADFTISSNQRIDIDSNWGGIYMKSDSAVLKTFENAKEFELNKDFYAKATLDAPLISIRAAGTSSDGATHATFKAVSDNSAEASITLGKDATDLLQVDYVNASGHEKKQDMFYADGKNAKIDLAADQISLNQNYEQNARGTTHADLRNLFLAKAGAQINVRGQLIANGNTSALAGSKVNLQLSNESNYTGAVFDQSYDNDSDHGSITIKGSEVSVWNVLPYKDENDRGILFDGKEHASTVDYLSGGTASMNDMFTVNLDRNSIINKQVPDHRIYQSLHVNHLESDGVKFVLGFDDREHNNDRDFVEINDGKGEHGVYVNYKGSHDSDEAISLRDAWLVTDKSANAHFKLTNKDGKVDIGLYQYELVSEMGESQLGVGNTANYWYLKRTEDGEISEPGDTALSFTGSQRYLHWADLQDLRKRMGEVRYGSQDGVWARVIAQKDLTDGSNGSSGLEQKYKGLNIGFDRFASVAEEKMWLLGASLSVGDAEQEARRHRRNKGETDRYGLNLYATYANNKGSYTDIVFSGDYFKQETTTFANDVAQKGEYNTWGLGISAEVGHQFTTESNDVAWGPWYRHSWIEPQLQLAYYWLKGEDYQLSNQGIRVEQKDEDSLIARAGIVIGTKWNYRENYEMIDKRYVQVWAKGGVKHDFLGDYQVTLNDCVFSDDIGKTTVYYGLGGDWQFSDHMRLYFQAERESGSNYTKEYEVSAGLKYSF